jgi:hypothetical protein
MQCILMASNSSAVAPGLYHFTVHAVVSDARKIKPEPSDIHRLIGDSLAL